MAKGIILAGGKGTRLYPLTLPIVKQLLPVYDKPMVYYPLSTLMLAGVREFLLISTKEAIPQFETLLGDGSQLGISIQYAVQEEPRGIAEALIIGEKFFQNGPVWLILGDNLFFGHGLPKILQKAQQQKTHSVIFVYRVRDPERYGVAELDPSGKVLSIEEKPKQPKSPYAVTGLYYYHKDAAKLASTLQPSARGELEISDLNNLYLKKGELKAEILGRGFAWLDTGTHTSLLDASLFVSLVEQRQGMKIGCIEEVAFRQKWISKEQLLNLAQKFSSSEYGTYLTQIAQEED